MNLADVAIVVAALVFLVVGWHQGLLRALWAFVGLMLGTGIGIVVVPPLLDPLGLSVWVSIAALAIVGLSAIAVSLLALVLEQRVAASRPWHIDDTLRRLGGAIFGFASALMVSWMLGLALAGSALPHLSRAAQTSVVLGVVGRIDLPVTNWFVGWFSELGDEANFQRYVDPFAHEDIVPVGLPPLDLMIDPEVGQARPGVARVLARTGPAGEQGSGFWVGEDRLMTAAHVVDDAEAVVVESGGAIHPAQLVVCDLEVDVAVLDVPGGEAAVLGTADPRPRQSVAVLGFPEGGEYAITPARIRSREDLQHQVGRTTRRSERDVWALRGEIEPGHSGGPVVDRAGRVVAMVISSSLVHPETAYALTWEQMSSARTEGLVGLPRAGLKCR